MTDKLKALALAANVIDHNERAEWYTAGELLERYMTYHKNARFIEAASPDVVLGLLAENERLKSAMNPDWDVKSAALESVREHMEIAAGLRAEIERLKAQEPVAYLMTFNDGTTTIQKSPYWDSCKSVEPLFLASGAAQKVQQCLNCLHYNEPLASQNCASCIHGGNVEDNFVALGKEYE